MAKLVRLYQSKSTTVLVFSGNSCPRIKLSSESAVFRDDFSDGFRLSKQLAKTVGST